MARTRKTTRDQQPRIIAILDRPRIAEVALALIDQAGVEGLSTRKLGALLGVEAMAIYHHFPSKDHLLDAVAEWMLLEAKVPGPEERGGWRDRLSSAAHSYRAGALRHPHAFPLLATRGHRSVPTAARYRSALLGIIAEAGHGEAESARALALFRAFLDGALLAELPQADFEWGLERVLDAIAGERTRPRPKKR